MAADRAAADSAEAHTAALAAADFTADREDREDRTITAVGTMAVGGTDTITAEADALAVLWECCFSQLSYF